MNEFQSLVASSVTVNPDELFGRLARGSRFIPLTQSSDAALSYFLHNVYEDLRPHATALWVSNHSGSWSRCARAGQDIPEPIHRGGWEEYNSYVAGANQVVQLPIVREDEPLTIWSTSMSGFDGFAVMHLLTPAQAGANSLLKSFFEASAVMLAAHWFVTQNGHRSPLRARAYGRPLSARQSAIADLMSTELTYAQIAKRLGFSESTVRQEAMQIFDKLGVANRAGVVLSQTAERDRNR